MNLVVNLMGVKTTQKLEDLAIRIANELSIPLSSGLATYYPKELSGSNNEYDLSYHVDEQDEDGHDYESVIVKRKNESGRILLIFYLSDVQQFKLQEKPNPSCYSFTLIIPRKDLEKYRIYLNQNKDSITTRTLESQFIANVSLHLNQHLPELKSEDDLTNKRNYFFISFRLKIREDELNQITGDLIKKYLNI